MQIKQKKENKEAPESIRVNTLRKALKTYEKLQSKAIVEHHNLVMRGYHFPENLAEEYPTKGINCDVLAKEANLDPDHLLDLMVVPENQWEFDLVCLI